MRQKEKKIYNQPELTEVTVDKSFTLFTASENNPPGQPSFTSSGGSDTSTSSDETTTEDDQLKDNNFEDNPFQR
ncbi:hypothetical protein [Anaerophaga thermohalophila]|jgi:hypothetical protein|uniref:hypothetical protein n=1 Tax=Anaerophaga thermohalophila TaxID=177400 RepID=UPI0002F0D532|nr:hypothetical protein [Anaerophaga thermohalophila]